MLDSESNQAKKGPRARAKKTDRKAAMLLLVWHKRAKSQGQRAGGGYTGELNAGLGAGGCGSQVKRLVQGMEGRTGEARDRARQDLKASE